MLAALHTVCSFIAQHALGTAAAILAFVGAAVIAYAREQVRAGTDWALAPLTRILPWNKRSIAAAERKALIVHFSLVDVFLRDTEGRVAQYAKTSGYVVAANELNSYREGVTAEGYANEFLTMRGSISETLRVHGFYMSRIDLMDVMKKGSRFTNIYKAELHDCFTKREEHWTQEIAFPTEHLILQIHFPKGRPPKSMKCKIVEGTTDRPIKTVAQIVDLFGKKSIVWEVQNPTVNEVLKLEWTW